MVERDVALPDWPAVLSAAYVSLSVGSFRHHTVSGQEPMGLNVIARLRYVQRFKDRKGRERLYLRRAGHKAIPLSPEWEAKIAATRSRDARNFRRLRRMGWTVIRIWEHQIKRDLPTCIERIAGCRDNLARCTKSVVDDRGGTNG